MILPIITIPNNNLRQKSRTLDKDFLLKAETQKFFDDLIETMYVKDGVGLAAIQVDQPLRVFAIAMDEGALVFINPQIIKKSFLKEKSEEGCLSIPNTFGIVKRHKKITVQALDREGHLFELEADGLIARAIQHENDHLNGILFTDKCRKIIKQGATD